MSDYPPDWEEVELGQVFEVKRGDSRLTKSAYRQRGVLAFSASGPDGFVEDCQNEGDGIVISSVGAQCGKIFKATGKWTAINNTIAITERSERHSIDYLFHLLDRQEILLPEGGAQPFISQKEVVGATLLSPPLPEQKKIAEILSGIDRVLSSSKHRIQRLQLLKKALVCRHVENAGNAIEEAKLYDVLVSMDSGWSPECLKRPPLSANEWSVLKTTSVTWKGFNQEERKALPSNLVPRQVLVVEEGDILITRAGPADRTGVIAYADKKADKTMISDKIIRLKCDKNRIDPRFLSIFLSTDYAQRQILKGKAGMASSQTNISQQLLRDMTVRFPPLPEQRHVSELVAEIQKLINQAEEYMEHTGNLKTSLSADLLSGRMRVTL